MFTKSKIQMIKESCEIYNSYRDKIENLMEKYNIEDSIFVFKNNQMFEATQGYFETISSHKSLKDAMNACNYAFDTIGIRILENKTFEIGYIRKTISECSKQTQIYDIDALKSL